MKEQPVPYDMKPENWLLLMPSHGHLASRTEDGKLCQGHQHRFLTKAGVRPYSFAKVSRTGAPSTQLWRDSTHLWSHYHNTA